MQNRSTILILLFTVTLAVGALTFLHSSNDNEVLERFRSFFSTSTLYDLKYSLLSVVDYSLLSVVDRGNLLYGGISLFAIIMIVLVLRAARRAASRDPRNG